MNGSRFTVAVSFLLLFTAVPLAVVVATATFFVLRNKQKAPLS